jgi:hypothetical protein
MPSKIALSRSLCLLVVAIAAVFAMAGSAFAALPDIQQAPSPISTSNPISVNKVGGEVQLSFPSQINVMSDGGDLTITGSRQDTTVDTMDAFEGGFPGQVVGALQFNYDPTHNHWHYLALDRYELRTHDTSLDSVARDQKTGFCLFQSNQQNLSQFCQQKQPNALSVFEAITAGNNDIYEPSVDGQYIDVTGLNGTYELIQWVNADCRLKDTGPANHSFSTVVKIDATTNPPTVQVVPTSPGQPAMTTNGNPFWTNYYAGLANKCLPAETVRPVVSGTAQVGSKVSAAPGSWLTRMVDGVSGSFAYQWRRCNATGWACGDIPGANSANYTVTSADQGSTLRARVTGNFPGTTEQHSPQDSEATAVVPGGTTTTTTTTSSSGQSTSTTTTTTTTSTTTTSTSSGGGGGGGGNGSNNVVSLTASIKALRFISVTGLMDHGLRARAHCSERCRVGFTLMGRGGVKLGHVTGLLTKSGSRTLTMTLSRKARKVVARFHSGTFTLWLHVKGHDGEQQTVSHVLHIKS